MSAKERYKKAGQDKGKRNQPRRRATARPTGVRLFLCDRDRKWSLAVRQLLERSGVHVIQTPFRAPNCNAHAERFVRSIKEECLKRVIPLVSSTFVGRWPSTWCITITNATTKASATH